MVHNKGVDGGRSITLEGCLKAFSTRETLDGDNRPMCSQCCRRQKSFKSLSVHRFPPVLVIHLKRFQYDSTSRKKLSTSVDVPLSGLDLTPFCASEACLSVSMRGDHRGHGAWQHLPRTEAREKRESDSRSCGLDGRPVGVSVAPVYELYGVCNHMGGLEGGHYTAHCRSQSNSGSGDSAEWHTFDDTRISRVSAARLGGVSAYVLFYRLAT